MPSIEIKVPKSNKTNKIILVRRLIRKTFPTIYKKIYHKSLLIMPYKIAKMKRVRMRGQIEFNKGVRNRN